MQNRSRLPSRREKDKRVQNFFGPPGELRGGVQSDLVCTPFHESSKTSSIGPLHGIISRSSLSMRFMGHEEPPRRGLRSSMKLNFASWPICTGNGNMKPRLLSLQSSLRLMLFKSTMLSVLSPHAPVFMRQVPIAAVHLWPRWIILVVAPSPATGIVEVREVMSVHDNRASCHYGWQLKTLSLPPTESFHARQVLETGSRPGCLFPDLDAGPDGVRSPPRQGKHLERVRIGR